MNVQLALLKANVVFVVVDFVVVDIVVVVVNVVVVVLLVVTGHFIFSSDQ